VSRPVVAANAGGEQEAAADGLGDALGVGAAVVEVEVDGLGEGAAAGGLALPLQPRARVRGRTASTTRCLMINRVGRRELATSVQPCPR